MGTEVRHLAAAEERVYLPEVHVTLRSRLPSDPEAFRRGPIAVPPDLAIEVLSPDDRPMRVLDRVDFYLRSGTRLIWIVDPDTRSVRVYGSEVGSSVHRPPGRLSATPVLAGFEVDLEELFASLNP